MVYPEIREIIKGFLKSIFLHFTRCSSQYWLSISFKVSGDRHNHLAQGDYSDIWRNPDQSERANRPRVDDCILKCQEMVFLVVCKNHVTCFWQVGHEGWDSFYKQRWEETGIFVWRNYLDDWGMYCFYFSDIGGIYQEAVIMKEVCDYNHLGNQLIHFNRDKISHHTDHLSLHISWLQIYLKSKTTAILKLTANLQ